MKLALVTHRSLLARADIGTSPQRQKLRTRQLDPARNIRPKQSNDANRRKRPCISRSWSPRWRESRRWRNARGVRRVIRRSQASRFKRGACQPVRIGKERVAARDLVALRKPYPCPLETISKPDVGRRYDAGAHGGCHARSCVRRARICAHRADGALRRRLAAPLGVQTMTEPIIGLAVAVMLGLYLLYTLIRPEKF